MVEKKKQRSEYEEAYNVPTMRLFGPATTMTTCHPSLFLYVLLTMGFAVRQMVGVHPFSLPPRQPRQRQGRARGGGRQRRERHYHLAHSQQNGNGVVVAIQNDKVSETSYKTDHAAAMVGLYIHIPFCRRRCRWVFAFRRDSKSFYWLALLEQ